MGHYEILSPLGKGGMGEVYRARDTKLEREVAIKVLPAEFAANEDRLARLEREARMLAALNHPNIAAIHGLEESDSTRFLVLELVEGDTLADRLVRGAIPPETALKLGLQIAEALEAAHEKGVVHRDLKPANIKITPEGRVKVLDFGLAKAFMGERADANLSNSPTLSMQATQAGLILGTAAYMAPEQAKGLPVDRRADVFAFGSVLFEMLTGRRAFSGGLATEILASVIAQEPDYTALQSNLHPRIRDLLRRCFEKDPANRWQAVGDLRFEIEKVLADPAGVLPRSVAGAQRAATSSRLAWVAAVVLAAATGVAVWTLTPSDSRPVSRWDYELPEGTTFRNVARPTVAISPDGRQFLYNRTGGLYLRSMDELEARLIAGTEAPLTNPAFSPDGQWIVFWSPGDLQLKKIAVVGGTAVRLADLLVNPMGISWDTDDWILFGTAQGVMRVSSDGGEPEVLVGGGAAGVFPQLLPGGDAVLVNSGGTQIGVYSLATGESTSLFPGARARYVPTGHIVYVDGNTLFAVPFDVDALEVSGGRIPLVEGIQSGPPQYAVSDSGSLIYVRGGSTVLENGVLTWVERAGGMDPLPVPARPYRHPRLSPDGRRLVVQTTTAAGESDIWVYDLGGSSQMRQMTGPGNNSRPTWTPDGERLVFTSDRDGTLSLYSQAADLTGAAERLTTAEESDEHWPDSFSPDGKTLSFSKYGGATGVWTLSMGEGAQPEVFVEDGNGSAFSPDGRWIVYRANRPAEQLYLKPFPPTPTELQVTQEGGSYPMWSPDGRQLFYRRGIQALGIGVGQGGRASAFMVVDVSLQGTPTWTNERDLPIRGFHVFFGSRDQDITPDGKRLLMVFPEGGASDAQAPPRPTIIVVENWFEELKARVPLH